MKRSHIKVFISTGEYYEETLCDENGHWPDRNDYFVTYNVSNYYVCLMFGATKRHYVYALDCSYNSKCDIVIV